MVPKGFFENRDNRLRYVNWLKEKVGASDVSNLRVGDFVKNHGSTLISMYGRSVKAVLDSLNASAYDSNTTLSESPTISNSLYHSVRFFF